jgi:hypothetical protein
MFSLFGDRKSNRVDNSVSYDDDYYSSSFNDDYDLNADMDDYNANNIGLFTNSALIQGLKHGIIIDYINIYVYIYLRKY